MIVRKNGTSHDGQIRVRADEIMRELPQKIKQFPECSAVDLHRNVAAVQDDAVLIIIDIRRILESPPFPLQFKGDDPQILPGRMVRPSGVTLVLHTKLTSRIGDPGIR